MQEERFEALLHEDRIYKPSKDFQENALIHNTAAGI